jgi:hypothetical protein
VSSSTSLLVTWDGASRREGVAIYASEGAIDFTARPILAADRGFYTLQGLKPGVEMHVAVRQVDAGDTNTVEAARAPREDADPPTFAGVSWARPAPNGGIEVGWEPAKDEGTHAGGMAYAIYVGEGAPVTFVEPRFVSAHGVNRVVVEGLTLPLATHYVAVRAQDAAGNLDSNTVTVATAVGSEKSPPLFDGCTSATALNAGEIRVTWAPASDPTTAPGAMTYHLFAVPVGKPIDYAKPSAVIRGQAGASTLTDLAPDTTYQVACRAVDLFGNQDVNGAVRRARTLADAVPPTFAGLRSSTFDPEARSLDLAWSEGADNATPASSLVYDVFLSEAAFTPGSSALQRPYATSAPGVTRMVLGDLPSNRTLHWLVRARDKGGNRDANLEQREGTTLLSFTRDMQPLLDRYCAVPGCHIPGETGGGLNLARGFSHRELMRRPNLLLPAQPSPGGVVTTSFVGPTPAESWLWVKSFRTEEELQKVGRGRAMPAPGTGSSLTKADEDIVVTWINQGAKNN